MRHLGDFGRMHVAMKKISDVYGRCMRIGLGNQVWVSLSGLDEIRDFSMQDSATYRPRSNDVLSDLYSFEEPLGKYSKYKDVSVLPQFGKKALYFFFFFFFFAFKQHHDYVK